MFNSLFNIHSSPIISKYRPGQPPEIPPGYLYFEGNETARDVDDKPTLNKLMWDNLVDKTFFYETVFNDFTNCSDNKLRMTGTDNHPSKEGHKIWGEYLIEFIKEL